MKYFDRFLVIFSYVNGLESSIAIDFLQLKKCLKDSEAYRHVKNLFSALESGALNNKRYCHENAYNVFYDRYEYINDDVQQ